MLGNLCQKSYCNQTKSVVAVGVIQGYPSKGRRYPGGIFEVSSWYLFPLSQPSNHHYLPNGHSGANDPWNPHCNPYILLIKRRFFPDQVFLGHRSVPIKMRLPKTIIRWQMICRRLCKTVKMWWWKKAAWCWYYNNCVKTTFLRTT